MDITSVVGWTYLLIIYFVSFKMYRHLQPLYKGKWTFLMMAMVAPRTYLDSDGIKYQRIAVGIVVVSFLSSLIDQFNTRDFF